MEALKSNTIHNAWNFFTSLRLTFVLLVIISLGAILGMSFDQTIGYEEFYQGLSAQSAYTFLLRVFELNDAFHSWWFSLSIVLLSANLIACSIERLPRIYFDYKNPRPFLSDRRLKGLTLKHAFTLSNEKSLEKTKKIFLGSTKSFQKTFEDQEFFFHERQALGRFGVYIVHIALLIIMYSSIVATLFGVDGHMMIDEGKKENFVSAKGSGGVSYHYDLGFFVKCEDFRLKTFVDNTPMEYESDLKIVDRSNREIESQSVRVNQPLSYAGFTFYQSNYRPILSEKIVELSIKSVSLEKSVRVKLNTRIPIDDDTTLIPTKVYEDFAGLGQALRLEVQSKSMGESYFHIFRRHPKFDQNVRQGKFEVILKDVDQKYATGLSVGKVPGIYAIFFGFLVLMYGLYLCFFTLPRRYFLRIKKDKSKNIFQVDIAMSGFRNPSVVKAEFAKKIELLTQELVEKKHA